MLLPFTNIIDMNFGKEGNNRDWYVVNDGVMGGLSSGTLIETQSSIIFKGQVSLENNGGFASIRSPYANYNLSKYETIEIKYRSSGYDFAITLQNHKMYFKPNYKHDLPNTDGEWQTVSLKMSDFSAYTLGRKLNYNLDKKTQKEIIRMGFISNEKRAGDFEIEIASIGFK